MISIQYSAPHDSMYVHVGGLVTTVIWKLCISLWIAWLPYCSTEYYPYAFFFSDLTDVLKLSLTLKGKGKLAQVKLNQFRVMICLIQGKPH
jgi:hypothetical protein